MNIILIGFRGCGKSTIARTLSYKIHFKYFSIDEEIKRRNGKSIIEIVNDKGWDYFRECEKKIISELPNMNKYVIDTGGGSILDLQNRANLKKSGKIIYLRANQKDLYQRISKGKDRPKLTDSKNLREEIKMLMKERREIYITTSDFIVNTSGHSINECVNSIIKKFSLK